MIGIKQVTTRHRSKSFSGAKYAVPIKPGVEIISLEKVELGQ